MCKYATKSQSEEMLVVVSEMSHHMFELTSPLCLQWKAPDEVVMACLDRSDLLVMLHVLIFIQRLICRSGKRSLKPETEAKIYAEHFLEMSSLYLSS